MTRPRELARRYRGEVTAATLAAAAADMVSGMFTTRPALLAGLLFVTARQPDVPAWWVPVQAIALLFIAWIVFDRVLGPADTMLRASLTGGGDPARTLHRSPRLKDDSR